MQDSSDFLQRRLQVLREQYVRDYPGRVNELRHSLDRLLAVEEGDRGLAGFHRQAHSLKGSGAMYGFPAVTDLASRMDAIASTLLAKHGLPDEQQIKEIRSLLKEMESLRLDPVVSGFMPGHAHKDAHVSSHTSGRNLLLVIDEQDESGVLQDQLIHHGYKAQIESDVRRLTERIEKEKPVAILVDIDLHDTPDAGFELLQQLRNRREDFPPVIFASDRDELELRLRAVREGGISFNIKPVQFGEIVDILDELVEKAGDEPYRILIVEDNSSLADFFSETLQSAGMETRIVTEPLQLLEQMIDFNPELVLMDVYMPGCEGTELASVIRQVPTYVSIPIVYLSGEKDIDKQLEAMSRGGDDFLTKPIQPRHLISSVQTTASRYRTLRSLMVRDSLTSLYNHTRTKELLEKELYRTVRNEGRLAFAMLDIDRFKAVNDAFGHMVGDRVIKSLARLLKQRLRKSDIVGRFGGEEFAVILYDTDLENAMCIMNDLRENFSRIIHKADKVSFQVTFSCGIAAYPNTRTAAELNEAADKALYRAKHAGRNRVELALPSK